VSLISTGVWERTDHYNETMTRNAFYFVIGSILSWGFILTMLVAKSTADWQPNMISLLLVGLGIPLVGILLSAFSENAMISFIGFNMVVGGMSAILGPVLAMYAIKEPGLIERAATMTALVSAVMGATGTMFPKFYESIGGALFGALTALVVVSIARIFIPAIQGVGVIDYISAGIFSLYIGYDMWRASEVTATLDNAVDIAVSLYLDVINLFLDLLRIMAKSKD
jgi:FtsH-binding integral membrane protein